VLCNNDNKIVFVSFLDDWNKDELAGRLSRGGGGWCLIKTRLFAGTGKPGFSYSYYSHVQAYIDQQLMMPLASGNTLDHAAICGLDGGIWAQSEGFPGLNDTECETLLKGFEDIGVLGEKGVTIGGNKYMLIASDPEDGIIRGKNGPTGVKIKKTVGAMVIGIYGENVTPGECNVVVENLADYLKEQGI
jgi:profilin